MNRLLYIRQEEVCGLILTTRLAGGGGGRGHSMCILIHQKYLLAPSHGGKSSPPTLQSPWRTVNVCTCLYPCCLSVNLSLCVPLPPLFNCSCCSCCMAVAIAASCTLFQDDITRRSRTITGELPRPYLT